MLMYDIKNHDLIDGIDTCLALKQFNFLENTAPVFHLKSSVHNTHKNFSK